jgi:hypothetical protein
MSDVMDIYETTYRMVLERELSLRDGHHIEAWEAVRNAHEAAVRAVKARREWIEELCPPRVINND